MLTVEERAHTGVAAGDPRFLQVDLALVRLAAEQAAEADPSGASEAELIDQVQQLEALQHSLAALQATRVRAFARLHVENAVAAGRTDPDRLQRGVVAQVGLACRVSPAEARRRVVTARDLHEGLVHVRGLFVAGELSTAKVAAVVAACTDLDRGERAAVDARLAEHDLLCLGVGRLRDLARRYAAEVAPENFRARVDAARAQRRVTLRPAQDAMTYLTAYLPVEQGVACLAALSRAFVDLSVDPEPLTRSRGQVMADTGGRAGDRSGGRDGCRRRGAGRGAGGGAGESGVAVAGGDPRARPGAARATGLRWRACDGAAVADLGGRRGRG